MQQPFTNSEAVRRCMLVPDAPRSSQMRHSMEPRPPYAVGAPRSRPYSAPPRHLSGPTSAPWRGSLYEEPRYRPQPNNYNIHLNQRAMESDVSRRAPYAARRTEAVFTTPMGYKVDGHSMPLPSYDPLSDPHLTDYFDKRFGAIQKAAVKAGRYYHYGRPGSAPPGSRYGRRGEKGKGKGDGTALYKVAVTTGDRKNAGTDAKVFLTVKGTRGKIAKTRLTKKAGSVKSNKAVSFRFGKGTTHVFKIRAPILGDIKSVVIEHNGTKKEDAWFLQEIEILNTKTKKTWVFLCNQWLSLHHTDGHNSRELFPHLSSKTDYEIVVVTGNVQHAGTNANCAITVFGKSGATPKIPLKPKNKDGFEKASSEIFKVHTRCVGPLQKVRIEHDNTGMFAGWFVERVVITDLEHPKWKYFFPCGQWLATDEGDGATSRDLMGSRDPFAVRKVSKYRITVYTGDKSGAGTDANVYVTLFGESGDSGERFLNTKWKNNFERGKKDEFVVESPCLGRLQRLRIGHDNTGFKAGWFLDKVIVDDVDKNVVYEFPCNRWFASDEDDGQIARDLLLNVGPMDIPPGIPYIITVTTGDASGAGTDARVYINMYGGKDGAESSGKIWLEEGNFKKGMTDIFNIDVAKMLSPLSKIEIGHDNSGAAPGWFLEQVIVYCASVGYEQFFQCKKWLARDEEDGLIQRTLFEQKGMRKKKEKKLTWYLWVHTSDIKYAGTDANVKMVLYGDKGKTDDIPLDNKGDNFEKGQVDNFKIEMPDVGKIYKMRVWHDNSGAASGWHLNKIEMKNMTSQDLKGSKNMTSKDSKGSKNVTSKDSKDSKEHYTFNCNRWLALDEDDHEIVREIPAEGKGIKKPLPVVHYSVEICTGNKRGAGTDANVYVELHGELGDTGPRVLTSSKTHRNKFEKGNTDEFDIEAVTLHKLSKVRVGHDGKGAGDGWFLDKIKVKQAGSDKYDTVFECNRWLATDEDDGAIERVLTAQGSHMLSTTTYHIYVKTGNVKFAGTDANVHMKMFGSKGDTAELNLRNSENNSNKFEKAQTDLFKIETMDIGQLKRIRIGHDGTGVGAGWFLDEVRIDIPSKGQQYIFACHRWLAEDEGDRLTEVELEPSSKEDREKTIPYEVTIWTGTVQAAGTDANVFLQIYGENGKTEECQLNNRTDNFESGDIDKFKVEVADVGRIQKIRIGHDGKRPFAGWFLDKLLIQRRPRAGTLKRKRRSSSAQERRKSLVSQMQGRKDSDSEESTSSSPRRPRKNQPKKKNLKTVEEEDEDEVYDGKETEDYWFFVNRWLATDEDDGAIIRELIPTDEKGRPFKSSLSEVQYVVRVFTGDVFGAGTDANVFFNLYGEKGDSGERKIDKTNHMNKFETKQEDIYKMSAIELGKLTKLKIRHDNAGGGAAWFLDRVEVEDTKNNKSYFFPCQRWLATGKDDGQIGRELVPVDPSLKKKLAKADSFSVRKEIGLETKAATTTYHVRVFTGTVFGAGTDANVYILLFGEKDNTDQMFLKASKTNKNKFEGGKMDEFILEAVDIGKLKKIKIGHDNFGGGAAWYLDKVVIDCPSIGHAWTFPCYRWLAKGEDDGEIERELFPQELETEEYIPCIPYEIKVLTSDVGGGSTSANVYIALYGKESCTQQKLLCANKQERKDKFNKGAEDLFIMELEDVGQTIEKIRIGHDNSGLTPGWHLDNIQIRKLHETGKGVRSLQGSITYTFPCKRWLARSEDDGAIERELVAEKVTKELVTKSGEVKKTDVKVKGALKNKKYAVHVKTGNVKGAGTDANVFLTIFGEKGDSGERKLHKSETYTDKFEKDHIDKFALEAVDLGKCYKIKIRHDNSLLNPAWYLESVEVIEDKVSYMFHCERWLAKNKDDGKIERTLYVKGYDGEMSSTGTLRTKFSGSVASLDSMKSSDPFSKSPRLNRKQMALEDLPEGPTIPYTIKVTTGEGDDNGTDSNVWVKILGPKKKHTGRLFLQLAQKDKFEPKSVEIFSLEAVDVDEVKRIEVGHDGVAPGTGWFVKCVEVDMPTKGRHYTFDCKQWLARDKGDGKTTRIFSVDDGLSSFTSYRPMVQYEVTVYTGDVAEAGTDQQIKMTLFGTKGSTTPTILEKTGDRFERFKADLIKMELEDVAPLKKMRIETDGKGSRPDWFLDKIECRNMDTGILSVFQCKKWFSKTKEGGVLVRDIPATEHGKNVLGTTSYKITVKTSDLRGAGTNANVYVNLFGGNGDSGQLHLKNSETNKSPFENGQSDDFTFEKILSLGELSKCRVWHDDKGFGAAWHLNSIEVKDLSTKKLYTFICDKWLSKTDDDKQIVRELTCGTSAKSGAADSKDKTTYEVEVTTTDKSEGGTIHHGWIILEGKKKSSKPFVMENSPQNKVLRRGQKDNFRFTTPNLGKLERCTVGGVEREDRPLDKHPQGREGMWHCHEVVITDTLTGDRFNFPCKDWIQISDRVSKTEGKVLKLKGMEEGQVSVVRSLAEVKYEVKVYTGSEFGAGTNANVFITIFGTNGNTGQRALTQTFRDLFEKKQEDTFNLFAIDLGELTKVIIEHDNSGFRPGWLLDRVEITNTATNNTYSFPCGQWLDRSKGDGATLRELLPRN